LSTLLFRDRDEALLEAENEKQKVLSFAEHEKYALQERLNQTQYTLKSTETELERAKQEALQKQAQDRETILKGVQELKRFRAQFEDTR
jgi:hypothetical protein